MQHHAPLAGRRILVVEDDFMIGEALSDVLAAAGATVVGPFGWLPDALAAIRDRTIEFDLAILDVDLHGKKSYAAADALVDRKVPFVFTTGYDCSAIDAAYRHHARCEKPVGGRAIVEALAQASSLAIPQTTPAQPGSAKAPLLHLV